MSNETNLPVVRKDESLQAWLRRSMPVLIEQGIEEAQAKKIAAEAWNRVNGNDQIAGDRSAKPAKEQSQDSNWGDSASMNEDDWGEGAPDPEAAAEAEWTNEETWGESLRDESSAAWGEEPAEEEGEQPETEEESSDEQPTACCWLLDKVEEYANTLLDQMAKVGHFEMDEVEGIQNAITSAMDRLEEELATLSEANSDSFAFEVAVPPAGFFKRPTKTPESAPAPTPTVPVPPATKSVAMEQEAPATDPRTPLETMIDSGEFVYAPADESSPTRGYVVPNAQKSLTLQPGALTPEVVDQFIADHADLWGDARNQLCALVDDAGNVQLCAATVTDNETDANTLGAAGGGAYLNVEEAKVYTAAAPAADAPHADDPTYAMKFFDARGFAGPSILTLPKRVDLLRGDLAIKSIGRGRVGNYLCVWGAPEQRDLGDEFFTPNTAELTAVFEAMGAIPSIYHHAMDTTLKSVVVGVVDRMEKDDTGLWIEAQIREHDLYKRMIMPLVEQRKLGWSSGTLPGARQVNKATGEILRWPIVEASMTPTPAEWRMATQWPVQSIETAYKAAGLSGFDPKYFGDIQEITAR